MNVQWQISPRLLSLGLGILALPALAGGAGAQSPVDGSQRQPSITVTDETIGPSATSPRYGNGAARLWVDSDYLMWWTAGAGTPPLVTTSPQGTAPAVAGVLGQPTTEVLFGGERLPGGLRSGGRLRVGAWLDDSQQSGIEGEYFALGENTDAFLGRSVNGDPILARPFYNVNTDLQDAEFIGLPNVVDGTVTAEASSRLCSAGLRMRFNLDEDSSLGSLLIGGNGARIDLVAGYRFLELNEGLLLRETLTSTNPLAPGAFDIFDRFDTRNSFHGGEIGFLLSRGLNRWSMDVLCKAALGNNHEVVAIDGGTAILTGTSYTVYPGGLLAQRTNMGSYSNDQFVVVPEVGVTLGYRLTRRLKATMGYSFLYCSHVLRPGDQIDTGVNPNLLPPEAVPFSGPLRPALALESSDYWAQGLSFGLEYGW